MILIELTKLRIELQKAALDLELVEKSQDYKNLDCSKAIPDPVLVRLENIIRDLTASRRRGK